MILSSIPIVYSKQFVKHETGQHPERPQRITAIEQALKESSFHASIHWIEPRQATVDELLMVHTRSHVDAMESLASRGGGMADPDTVVGPQSFEIACLSAGAALRAIDCVLQTKHTRAMAVSRPPGHHATADLAMGFCLFNNIAIAARYAQQYYNIKKILIVDWDVHHGNGTQDIFYEDDTVFFLSTHQHPHYPGTGREYETGRGQGVGYTKNLPFPPYTPPDTIVKAVDSTLRSITETFIPDLVLVSAGFDGHKDDPLGNWLLEEPHYRNMTRLVCDIANRCCQGRVVSCLEGGYNLKSLANSYAAHCEELLKDTA